VEINLLFSFFPSLKWQLDTTHLSLFLSSVASQFEDFPKFLSVSKVLRHFDPLDCKLYPKWIKGKSDHPTADAMTNPEGKNG
jgi:hypothetical protein